MHDTALTITGVRKVYKNGVEALKGVSLLVPKGDFFGLLGPNGAGKTTIIGIITGLVNKTEGSVKVFDADIDTQPELARTYIGLVPQEINFNIFDTVIDIVVNQGGYYGIPRSVALPRAEDLLRRLGLYDKRNDTGLRLSGGMKRRLMIARALIHKPQFLVLDEPTAGVDVELRRGMWDFLRELTDEGVTILLTTHYLEEAEQLCKHIAIINTGEIIEQGSMKEVLGRLHSEVVVLELRSPVSTETQAALAPYNPRVIDGDSIEIDLGKDQNLSEVMAALDVPVRTVRSKTGRLEEIFVRLTQN